MPFNHRVLSGLLNAMQINIILIKGQLITYNQGQLITYNQGQLITYNQGQLITYNQGINSLFQMIAAAKSSSRLGGVGPQRKKERKARIF